MFHFTIYLGRFFRDEDVSRPPGKWQIRGLVVQIFKSYAAESPGHSTNPEILFTCGEDVIDNGSEVWFCSSKDFQKLGVYLESKFFFLFFVLNIYSHSVFVVSPLIFRVTYAYLKSPETC